MASKRKNPTARPSAIPTEATEYVPDKSGYEYGFQYDPTVGKHRMSNVYHHRPAHVSKRRLSVKERIQEGKNMNAEIRERKLRSGIER